MSSVLWLAQSKSLRNGSCYHYYKDGNDNTLMMMMMNGQLWSYGQNQSIGFGA